MDTFIVSKQNKTWVVENSSQLEKSGHTTQLKAANYPFYKHPANLFYLVIPVTDNLIAYKFYRVNKVWTVRADEAWIVEPNDGHKLERSQHHSRPNALNAFFSRHPSITLFYIAIPAEGDNIEYLEAINEIIKRRAMC